MSEKKSSHCTVGGGSGGCSGGKKSSGLSAPAPVTDCELKVEISPCVESSVPADASCSGNSDSCPSADEKTACTAIDRDCPPPDEECLTCTEKARAAMRRCWDENAEKCSQSTQTIPCSTVPACDPAPASGCDDFRDPEPPAPAPESSSCEKSAVGPSPPKAEPCCIQTTADAENQTVVNPEFVGAVIHPPLPFRPASVEVEADLCKSSQVAVPKLDCEVVKAPLEGTDVSCIQEDQSPIEVVAVCKSPLPVCGSKSELDETSPDAEPDRAEVPTTPGASYCGGQEDNSCEVKPLFFDPEEGKGSTGCGAGKMSD